MSILRHRDPAVIAAVEVNDDYRVELRTDRKLTDYSPAEAEKLADELAEAASEARRKHATDHPVGIRPLHAHGFDTDGPLHRACREGLCGACDGMALNGRDELVPCTHGCHDTEGAAA
jgi:hypothetical protein